MPQPSLLSRRCHNSGTIADEVAPVEITTLRSPSNRRRRWSCSQRSPKTTEDRAKIAARIALKKSRTRSGTTRFSSTRYSSPPGQPPPWDLRPFSSARYSSPPCQPPPRDLWLFVADFADANFAAQRRRWFGVSKFGFNF